MAGNSSKIKHFVLVGTFLLILTWHFSNYLPDIPVCSSPGNTTSDNSFGSDLLISDVTGVWSQVPGRKAQLYSAFFDDRFSPPIVRVLAQIECYSRLPYFCGFRYASEERRSNNSGGNSNIYDGILVEANLTLINRGCDVVEAHFIDCKLSGAALNLTPSGVQIFGQKTVPTEQIRMNPILPIHYSNYRFDDNGKRKSNASQHYQHGLAICINRLFDWTDWILLILFIEYYQLQAATKFVVYHRSWSKDVDMVVKYYQKTGLLEVMPHPPLAHLFDAAKARHWPDLQQQIPLTNDCIYSLRGRAQFVTVLDLDEFLLPANASQSLLDFANHMTSSRKAPVGAIKFRNAFFASLFPASSKLSSLLTGDAQELILANLSNHFFGIVRCIADPYRTFSRTKYIVRPEAILRASVHDIWEFVPELHRSKDTQVLVDPRDALLFHLRKIDDNFDERARNLTCGHNIGAPEITTSPFATLRNGQALITRIQDTLSKVANMPRANNPVILNNVSKLVGYARIR